MSVNKAIIVGNLGGDPELRFTGTSQVCNFSVATSEKWIDKNGDKQERTEWHRVVVWGKLAESCSKYLAKGRKVYVEGKLQTNSWEGEDGIKRYSTQIVASTVQFLGDRGNGTASDKSHERGDSSQYDGDYNETPF